MKKNLVFFLAAVISALNCENQSAYGFNLTYKQNSISSYNPLAIYSITDDQGNAQNSVYGYSGIVQTYPIQQLSPIPK